MLELERQSNRQNNNNFVLQAGILAAAGIISRIIGLLYRSPLTAVVGPLGIAYYQVAYNFYTIVLLISSYSIPSAISKVIAQKLAVEQYRNAHRIFRCAMGYVIVVGGIASLALFFGAGVFLENPAAVKVLRTFAPTVFVYGILGVLRGYFQAHRSMVQTSVSQVLEQIVNAGVSIGAAILLIRAVMGTMEMPGDEAGSVMRATCGAIGSALGTGAGVLTALLFMAGVYAINRRMFMERIENDRHKHTDSYFGIVKTITLIVTPFILSTAVYNLSNVVNSKVFVEVIPGILGTDGTEAYFHYGIFSGVAQTISNIPIAFASAMASAMIPSVASCAAAGRIDEAREKIGVAVKSTMVISIPSAFGLLVLAKPVTGLLFPSLSSEVLTMAGFLLMSLSLSIVFYALSTLNSSILQGLGKVNTPILNAGIALVVQTALLLGLLRFTPLGLYSLAVANTVYSGMMFVLNHLAVRKAVQYRQEVRRTFLIPALAASLMAALSFGVYEAVRRLTHSMRISVLPAVPVAVMAYFAMLILFGGMTEEELKGFPKGHLLVKAAKKCRLMK